MVYEKIKRLYDSLNIDFGLPVDLVIMLMKSNDDRVAHYKKYLQKMNSAKPPHLTCSFS